MLVIILCRRKSHGISIDSHHHTLFQKTMSDKYVIDKKTISGGITYIRESAIMLDYLWKKETKLTDHNH
jgi:hypothetical protein